MARRVAVAWALMLLAAVVPRPLRPVLQGHPRHRISLAPKHRRLRRPTETGIRPATTTFFGDTGLWFVPTGEVLPHGKWSVSGYRRGTNYIQGFTNVGDFAGTFGVGIRDRAEIFGSFLFDTRIDRDLRPLFNNDPKYGGVVDRYPRVNRGWSGDNVGDFYLGAKFNFWSEYRQKPAAIALRGMFKAPTGDDDARRQHRQAPTSSSTPSSARNTRRAASRCRATSARSSAAAPTTSRFPAARSVGESAPPLARAARCAAPSSSTARRCPATPPLPSAPSSASTARSRR